MLEAAKSMFSKLLEETNDDLDRALQPSQRERKLLFSCRDMSEIPCPPTEAATEIPCSHCETEKEVIRFCSETISPSREPLEYVASGNYHGCKNNYSFDALQAYCFGINIKL